MFAPCRFFASTEFGEARTLAIRVAVEGSLTIASWSTGMSKENLVLTSIWVRQWWVLVWKRC